MRASIAGVDRMRWTGTTVDLWNGTSWVSLLNGSAVNVALLNATNQFTQPQTIVNASGAWSVWKDSTPTLGMRFAFNTSVADGIEIARFDGTDWRPKFTAGATDTNVLGTDAIKFNIGAGAAEIGRFSASGFTIFGGGEVRQIASDGTTVVVQKIDPLGAAYWNTADATLYQWYMDGALCASLNAGTFQLGRDTTLNIRNASDYGTTISSLASPGGVYYANNATYPHHFQIDGNNAFSVSAGIIDFWTNKELRIWNAGNSGYTLLQFLSDTSGGNQLRLAGRGAVIHHNDSGYTGGGIVTSTSPAPATGTAGVIYFEVV
jgi:hypothetical protein